MISNDYLTLSKPLIEKIESIKKGKLKMPIEKMINLQYLKYHRSKFGFKN